MSLELHSNSCAREAKPGLFMFAGKWVVILPAGVLVFIALFKLLSSIYLDWWLSAPIALIPLGLGALFVVALVNGRPPSYATDLWLLVMWRFKSWLYMHGCLDRPPVLWGKPKTPPHPDSF